MKFFLSMLHFLNFFPDFFVILLWYFQCIADTAFAAMTILFRVFLPESPEIEAIVRFIFIIQRKRCVSISPSADKIDKIGKEILESAQTGDSVKIFKDGTIELIKKDSK